MKGITFSTFPRPVIEESFHPKTMACAAWIKMCGRSKEKLSLKIILEDMKKRNYYYRVCSKVSCHLMLLTIHSTYYMQMLS